MKIYHLETVDVNTFYIFDEHVPVKIVSDIAGVQVEITENTISEDEIKEIEGIAVIGGDDYVTRITPVLQLLRMHPSRIPGWK